jgi:hypothetical protein
LVRAGRADPFAASTVTRTEEKRRELLDARNQYYETWTSISTVMLTPFRLKPSEDWAHGVLFFPLLSREDEKEQRQLSLSLRNDIMKRELICHKTHPT